MTITQSTFTNGILVALTVMAIIYAGKSTTMTKCEYWAMIGCAIFMGAVFMYFTSTLPVS